MRYLDSAAGMRAEQLGGGFFAGWPNPPDAETHLQLLRNSDHVAIAVDERSDNVVGFATALTDGVLSAFIPLLEVLPAWRSRGVGTALVQRLIADLTPLYAIDVVCDPDVQPFYERIVGFHAAGAMSMRDYTLQPGRPASTA